MLNAASCQNQIAAVSCLANADHAGDWPDVSQPASAQLIINYAEKGVPPEAGLELLQEEPHDIIFFKASAGGGWVKVRLLPFPGRKIPGEADRGALKFQIVDIEGQGICGQME